MNALIRADMDEQDGDFGMARTRLISYIVTTKYDAAICERIARICWRMGDIAEAGKWYFLCDSKDDEAGRCIQRFRQRHGFVSKSILASLPSSIVKDVRNGLAPPVIVKRIAECDPDAMNAAAAEPYNPGKPSLAGRAAYAGCIVVMCCVVALTCIGFVTLVRWVLP